MKIRLVAVAAGVALLATAPAALAHHDADDSQYCDLSGARGGHSATPSPTDVVVSLPGGYELWAPGGHYVLRGNGSYVEVVGGQGYNVNGNQGGYAQGSIAPAGSPAQVDFHANVFAGSNSPNTSQFACLHIDAAGQDQKVATPGGTQPSQLP